MPLATGTQLGPYEILAPLGAGGMGEVYKARDTRLDRTVALKVSKQEFSQRFEREARTIASLNHTRICQLYDVGPNYLVMELVEGQPLKGPLPLDRALADAAQILDALDAAHQKGIIHRDLKPANILVTKQGIKLLDFGLAKPIGPTLKESDATLTAALTVEGQILGTLQYMSPEQLHGKEADARSDIFAFGCVFYEMLTGKRAFDGKSVASLIAALVERDSPSVGDVAPPALDQLIRRAMAKDPDQRWQTARDLKSALELAVQPRAQGQSARSRPWPWIVATAGFAVLAALAFWSPWRHEPSGGRALTFQIHPPPGTQFVFGNDGGSAISPDGGTVAFVAGDSSSLWIRALDSAAAREIPGTDGAHHPFWSPDSRSLGFFSSGELKRVDISGTGPVVIAKASPGRGGTWNREGIILFAPYRGGLMRVSANGGMPVTVTTIDSSIQEMGHWFPEFLPDGRRFLCFSWNAQRKLNRVFLSSMDHPIEKVWLIESMDNAAFIPVRGRDPAYLVWLRPGEFMARPFDPGAGRLSGEPLRISGTEPVSSYASGYRGEAAFSVSHDGSILFPSGNRRSRLTWFSRDGKVNGGLGKVDRFVSLRISPDGARVSVQTVDGSGGRDISIIDVARGVQSALTSGGDSSAPVWSPDSRRIVYCSIGGRPFFERDASGAAPPAAILQLPQAAYPLDWSPDGRYLLYQELQSDGVVFWLLPTAPDGRSSAKPIFYLKAASNYSTARFTRDGKWIAYSSDESGQVEIYVQSFPAGDQKWHVSPAGGNHPRWRADGKELFFRALDGKLMATPVRAVEKGLEFGAPVPVPLIHIPEPIGPLLYSYDISPDGQRILTLTPESESSVTLTVLMNWQTSLKQ